MDVVVTKACQAMEFEPWGEIFPNFPLQDSASVDQRHREEMFALGIRF